MNDNCLELIRINEARTSLRCRIFGHKFISSVLEYLQDQCLRCGFDKRLIP